MVPAPERVAQGRESAPELELELVKDPWLVLAAQVAEVYRTLPADEQKEAVFLGNNYGEAAAIDVLGRPLGLPPAVSGHNNYFLWGPQGHDGSVVIRLGGGLAFPQQSRCSASARLNRR